MINTVFQGKARISGNQTIGRDYFRLVLECPEIARIAAPGQFVEVKASGTFDPLLRRPFGVHRVKGKTLEILVEIVGKATEILAQKRPGEYLDIIGPLGNGFDFTQHSIRTTGYVLIAGGMGVAPLVFLAEKLVYGSRFPPEADRTVHKRPVVLIGARKKAHILCEKEFKKLGCEVRITTNDGSKGHKGKVTDLFNAMLSTVNCQLSTIYACGPAPMLREVSRSARLCNLSAQLSLEAHMSCGIGACLGCVVKTLGGYKRVCRDGPVFRAQEIIWD